jgi:hypothetical protein
MCLAALVLLPGVSGTISQSAVFGTDPKTAATMQLHSVLDPSSVEFFVFGLIRVKTESRSRYFMFE